ncbi:hypothetical protein PSY31_23640, partial [Shigella flexneri]|nr:hypothetical protein [Shigella flexneri]
TFSIFLLPSVTAERKQNRPIQFCLPQLLALSRSTTTTQIYVILHPLFHPIKNIEMGSYKAQGAHLASPMTNSSHPILQP